MGGKQTRAWLHHFIYAACCILMGIGQQGCTVVQKQDIPVSVVTEAEHLLAKGRYSEAVAMCQRVIDSGDPGSRDQALFVLAMAYAHPDNPDIDLEQAAVTLRQLQKAYPHSGKNQETAVFLNLFALHRHAEGRLEAVRNALAAAREKIRAVTDEKQRIAAAGILLQNTIHLQEKELARAQELVSELQEQIDQLKKIDLTTEEKKRDIIHNGQNGIDVKSGAPTSP